MYYVLSIVAALLSALPVVVADRLAWVLAVFIFDILRVRRKLILKNLEIAFGDDWDQAKRIDVGRKSVYHFILTTFELLRSQHHDLTGGVRFVGLEYFRKALAEGRGAYIACCHVGNWEAHGAAVARHVHPAHLFVKRVGGVGTNRWIHQRRVDNGMLPVQPMAKGEGTAWINQAFDRNEAVAIVMDQARSGSPRLPFFGKPAKANWGFAGTLRKRQAPVLATVCRRLGFNQFEIEFFPPMDLASHLGKENDAEMITKCLLSEVEKIVRINPEQYFWMHNRWK